MLRCLGRMVAACNITQVLAVPSSPSNAAETVLQLKSAGGRLARRPAGGSSAFDQSVRWHWLTGKDDAARLVSMRPPMAPPRSG